MPWFLLLLPLFFVLHGYTENYPLISFVQAFMLFLKSMLWTAITFGLLFVFYRRDPKKAALSCFILFFVFFFFGPIHDFIKQWMGNTFIARYVFLLPALTIGYLVWLRVSRRKEFSTAKLFSYMSVLFVILLAIDSFQLFGKHQQYMTASRELGRSTLVCDSCDKPDVYLIVADGYSGDKALKDIFGFDNSRFQRQLAERGFFVVDNSVSNYNFTPFTIASTLSMAYLRGLKGFNRDLTDRQTCYKLINKNYVTSFFGAMGYQFQNFSIFRFADHTPLATSKHYKSGTDLLIEQTLLGRFNRDIRFNTVTRFKIKSEINKFLYYELESNKLLYESFQKEIKNPATSPRFFYTHLEMPHYPYYFDSLGNPYLPLDVDKSEGGGDRRKYINYLVYANAKYLELIDEILNTSKKSPVIMFISDHGYREYNDSTPLRYHYMNMNAILIPSRIYSEFKPGMSTVNLFRALLNSEFKQKLPYLKDSTVFIRE